MTKPVNYSKASKHLIVKDGDIIAKTGQLFIDKEQTSLLKVGTITLSGATTISIQAFNMLREANVTVIINYKNHPVAITNITGSPALKKKQADIISNNSNLLIKRLISIRKWATAEAKLSEYPDHSPAEARLMVVEARYMKNLYRRLTQDTELRGKSKMTIGKETAMHVWWGLLYCQIETCIVRMGLDLDLGGIHQRKKALVYDIADTLKPLLIKQALEHKPQNINEFYQLWKTMKLQKLLPILLLWLIDQDKTSGYSWPRSYPYREFLRKRSMSSFLPRDL